VFESHNAEDFSSSNLLTTVINKNTSGSFRVSRMTEKTLNLLVVWVTQTVVKLFKDTFAVWVI
jgi:hypothetical protein